MSAFFSEFSIYFQFYIAIFAIINPLGIIPMFNSMTENMYVKDRNRTNLIASVSVGLILFISLILGNAILKMFSLSIDAFRIAGGFLLISVAIQMLGGKIGDQKQNKEEKESVQKLDPANIAVVPLAMPILAGPGAISTSIIWGTKYNSIMHLSGLFFAIICISITIYILFRSASLVLNLLSKTASNLLTRIMGLLIMSIGVQMIVGAIGNLFPMLVSGVS